MLDIKAIRKEPDRYAQALSRRGGDSNFEPVIKLDERRRFLIVEGDRLRNEKSTAEKGMKTVDRTSPEFDQFRVQMKSLAQSIKEISDEQTKVDADQRALLLSVPNVPSSLCPDGESESDNVVVRVVGEPTPKAFDVIAHDVLATDMGLLDQERAAKIAGARFSVYRGALARLERALIQLMLDVHTEEHGYEELLPPFMVNEDSMIGTGQFPKFRDDAFLLERDKMVLIPTAEVPVTNFHRDEILGESDLPTKYTAYTPCFRREAGSYGRDTRGLIRQHQFQKVELVQFVTPAAGSEALEALTGHAENILSLLELPYRVMDLCAGDLGFSAERTYDLEVWVPSQGCYREISSCSLFGQFQSRRANIRFRAAAGGKPQYLSTVNGSGLAVGRTVVAILENHQTLDGNVMIPEALRTYMGGRTHLI
jgi:seryl-tRNA synthetase